MDVSDVMTGLGILAAFFAWVFYLEIKYRAAKDDEDEG